MHLNKERIQNRIRDIEWDLLAVMTVIAGIYYAYRMFAFAPWYDELYTYNFFISRGPVYAGIHWPVPNNHLGYSALSGAVYMIIRNPYIGNLIMLCMISRRLTGRGFAPLIPAIYIGAWQVNVITVQGRGYALSANMMLLAVVCLLHICFDEEDGIRYYVLWAFSMVLGFYTVMTTLYWVVTICFCALTCLLALNKPRRLVRVIISSVAAAVGTLFVYSVVWLAIGSNLLSKEEGGMYFGMYQLNVIKADPVGALRTGAEYMLATPYIQSVSREGYIRAFTDHFVDIFNHYYPFGIVLMILTALSMLLAVMTVISRRLYLKGTGVTGNTGESISSKHVKVSSDETGDRLICFSWLVICFALVTPVTVFIQSKLPYVRTFMFYAVAVAMCISYLLYVLFGALRPMFTNGLSLIVTAIAFAYIFSSDYNTPYGDKEQAVLELMRQVRLDEYADEGLKICLTDCDQEYMYRFLYDEYPESVPMNEADIIILDKEMLDPDAEYHWEFYYDHSSVDHAKINGMKQLLRNTYYEVYAGN